ncbi:potassium voltage-gated channel subfamily KQT [alpha proteobacterium U9-1i]|nr:potassium voltage-gated channel subfamily KQT [alpha proteobacterium U9-1i]
MSEAHPLRSRLRELYYGHTEDAVRFQGVLFVLDLAVIVFFLISQFITEQRWFWLADGAIAAFVALDLGARLFALGTFKRWLKFPTTWIDLVVLATLLAPAVLHNWGFLRVLRLWTLVHTERFWNVLARGKWDDTYVEDLTKAITTLFVFIFLSAGAAQALFLGDHPKLNNFIDALYFVVTSLTTTGYGDITIDSAGGRLFSMALMLIGISLFFSIAQKAFAPQRRFERCSCGQDRHELDARHCKSCGARLREPVQAGG